MKISIITPCYNAENTIADTICSVASQTVPVFEHIIVDGLSSDATASVVAKYTNSKIRFISESDNGLYNAMNKGVRLAKGDIIVILNSDDYFMHPGVLQKVLDLFTIPDVKACYGDIVYVDRTDIDVVKRRWIAGNYAHWKWWFGWVPPHPAFFALRELYEQFGFFREDFSVASDYELLLRWCFKKGVKPHYIAETLVKMREGGFSARNLRQRLRGWKELYCAWLVNRLIPPPTLVLTRIVTKTHQFLYRNK